MSVADKEGILRYVGKVQFASGDWCGIELFDSVGKNNGRVRGVQYFSCPEAHGLMAPLANVKLNENFVEDLASGPYSTFFDLEENDLINNRSYDAVSSNINNRTFNKNNSTSGGFDTTIIRSNTFGASNETFKVDDEANPAFEINRTFVKQESDPTLSIQNESSISENRRFSFNRSGLTFECVSQSMPKLVPKLSLEDLDFDHSLGILMPEEMGQNTILYSPNIVDTTTTDLSLGILDEDMLANLNLTRTNMELTLDKNVEDYARLEQTPSPEDLPLDPMPIIATEPKTNSTRSASNNNNNNNNNNNSNSNNSFITSITSITSLDIGYQGDGEMSRPASRGADNSPLTRRPLPRPQPRRQDPMTDSDFYTESDADNHEDHPLRGDRKAQVIDGTLYGVDPQEAADIYVNNRENMDSSGIFTDIETNTRAEELSIKIEKSDDISPSDSSTQTITEKSQANLHLSLVEQTETPAVPNQAITLEIQQKELPTSPSTVTSSPVSSRSPRHTSKIDAKKYKMPKRNVPSKVKAMLEPSINSPQKTEKKMPVKKVAGRWDAVMNKITMNNRESGKPNMKDIKSKVFNSYLPTVQNRESPKKSEQKPNIKM